jgi:hypothetical protein
MCLADFQSPLLAGLRKASCGTAISRWQEMTTCSCLLSGEVIKAVELRPEVASLLIKAASTNVGCRGHVPAARPAGKGFGACRCAIEACPAATPGWPGSAAGDRSHHQASAVSDDRNGITSDHREACQAACITRDFDQGIRAGLVSSY